MLDRPDFGTGLQGAAQMESKKSLLSVFVKCLLVSDTLLGAEDTAGMRQMLPLLLRFISHPARQVKHMYQYTVSDGAVGEN